MKWKKIVIWSVVIIAALYLIIHVAAAWFANELFTGGTWFPKNSNP